MTITNNGHLYDASSIANPGGAGNAVYTANGGIWDAAALGNVVVGTVTQTTFGARGFVTPGLPVPDGAVCMMTHRGILLGARNTSFALADTVAGVEEGKSVTSLQEQGGGAASIFADLDFDLLVVRLLASGGAGRARVIAMGRITGGAVPVWAWASGAIDQATPITFVGAGNYRFFLLADQAADAADTIMLAQVATEGLRQTSAALQHISDTEKAVTLLQEGAGGVASVLTNMDVNVVVLQIGGRPNLEIGRIHAMASIRGFAATNDYAFASGAIDQAIAPRTGAGAYTINYLADQGVPELQSVNFCTPRGALIPNVAAGSGMVSIAVDTSAGLAAEVGIQVRQEDTGATESVPADFDFDFLSFRLIGV